MLVKNPMESSRQPNIKPFLSDRHHMLANKSRDSDDNPMDQNMSDDNADISPHHTYEEGLEKRQILDGDGAESKLKLSKVPYQSSGGIMN